jgi:hypothetical protein
MSNNYQANSMNLTGSSTGGDQLPELLSKIKNSFDALATGNSGTSSPPYVQPYVTWINSNTNLQYYISPTDYGSVLLNNFSPDNVIEASSNIVLSENSHKQTFLVDCSGGALTVTLSTLNASTDSGYEVNIKKIDNSGNTLTILHSDIDGESQLVLREKNDSVEVVYHGSKYYVRSSNIKPLHVPSVVTDTYTLVPEDHFKVILINNTAPISVNLPDAATLANGYSVTLKKISGASLDVTVTTNGADTIEGANSIVLDSQYAYFTLISDQSGVWYKVSGG